MIWYRLDLQQRLGQRAVTGREDMMEWYKMVCVRRGNGNVCGNETDQ